MVKIVFTKAPKQYQKALGIGVLGHSRKFTADQASERIKNIAQNLKNGDQVEVSYTILYDQGEASVETKIGQEDTKTGLASVQDRVAEELGNTEVAMDLLNKVLADLSDQEEMETVPGELVDDSEDDDEADPEEDDPIDENFDEEIDEDPWGNNANDKEIKEDEDSTSTVGASASDDAEKKPAEAVINLPADDNMKENIEQQYDQRPTYDPTNVNVEAFKEDGNDDPKVEEPKQTPTLPNKADEVMGMTEFFDTKKIFANLKNYPASAFDYDKDIKALGYKAEPKDKYERKLNGRIQGHLSEYKITDLSSEYQAKINEFKQQVAVVLDKTYNEVQSKTIAQAVDENTKDQVKKLQDKADKDKQAYKDDVQEKIEHRKTEANNRIKEQVAEYQRNLQAKADEEITQFEKEEQVEITKANNIRDEQLAEKVKDLKTDAEKAEIKKRNAELLAKKQEVTNSFINDVSEAYKRTRTDYKTGLIHIRGLVLASAKKLDAEKAEELAEKRRLKEEQEQRQELKRQNDLKEREIANREKNAEEQRKLRQQEIDIKRQRIDRDLKAKREKDARELEIKQKRLEEERKANMALPKLIFDAMDQLMAKQAQAQKSVYDAQIKALMLQNGKEMPKAETIEKVNAEKTILSTGSKKDTDNQSTSTVESSLAPTSESIKNSESETAKRVVGKLVEDDQVKKDPTPNNWIDDADNKKSAKKQTKLIAGVCGVALILAGGFGGTVLYHQTHSDVKTHQIAPTHKNAKPQVASGNSNLVKHARRGSQVEQNGKNKATNSKKTQAEIQSDNNLNDYEQAKTWPQKVDALNAMLGQHDDRALKQINDSTPSKMSQLYEAIVLNQPDVIRNVWLSMGSQEHAQMSRPAMNSTAMAFYNASDWQHGWEARNGI